MNKKILIGLLMSIIILIGFSVWGIYYLENSNIEDESNKIDEPYNESHKDVEDKSIQKDEELNVEDGEVFVSVWDTTKKGDSGTNEIKLPLIEGGEYDFIVESKHLDEPVHINSYQDPVIEFNKEGVHEINITGTIRGWSFGPTTEFYDIHTNDRGKIIEIKNWGDLELGNSGSYFLNAINLNISANDSLNLENTNTLFQMFRMPEDNNFTISGDINNWNTSNINNMEWMFGRAHNMNSDISDWDVSNVDNMGKMFSDARDFNQDLSNWDVSNVKYMDEMFRFSKSFNQNISNWDVSNVEDMSYMFRSAESFNQDLSRWDVSNVEDMRGMFRLSNMSSSLNCWNVEHISEKPTHFYSGSPLENNTENLPNWGEEPNC